MRFIDADVLKESLKKVTIAIDEDVLKCETLGDELLYLLERVEAEMKKKIDECLTAFDIEAVVNVVREAGAKLCANKSCNNNCDCCAVDDALRDIIDAIRKGGVKNE